MMFPVLLAISVGPPMLGGIDYRGGRVPPFAVRRLDGRPGVNLNRIAVDFSPDGRMVAACPESDTVRVWEVANGRVVATLDGHEGRVGAAVFSPDGRRVVTGEGLGGGLDDNSTRICGLSMFDLASGKRLWRTFGHLHAVRSIAFTPDGKRVVTGGGDDRIRWWDAATGERLGQIRDLTKPLIVGFIDGAGAVVVENRARVRIIHIPGGKEAGHFGLPKRNGQTWYTFRLTPDRRALLAERSDGWFSISLSKPHAAVERKWAEFHGDHVHALDGETVLETRQYTRDSGDRRARFLHLPSGGVVPGMHTGSVGQGNAAFSADGKWLATVNINGDVIVWDAAALRAAAVLGVWMGDEKAARRAALAGEGFGNLEKQLSARASAGRRVRALLPRLDSDDFEEREKASKELEALGGSVAPAITAALGRKPSTELQRRLRKALERLPKGGEERWNDPEQVRGLLVTLGLLRTPAAVRLLRAVAVEGGDLGGIALAVLTGKPVIP